MSFAGGYLPRNGAKDAPVLRNRSADINSMDAGDDFPMLCETCLGPNPYVRMVKMPFGQKLCKISTAPYQAFRWKAGPNGRFKETIISFAVAKQKNICQTCLNDMQFGLPVGVRDKLLSKQEGQAQLNLPRSDVGTRYFYEQQANQSADLPQNFALELQNIGGANQLERFSRTIYGASSSNSSYVVAAGVSPYGDSTPNSRDIRASGGAFGGGVAIAGGLHLKQNTAFRNLPKLCSFWLAGTCTRVARGTCPFRPCCGTYIFPEIAVEKEMCAKLVDDLKLHGPDKVQKSLDSETKEAIREAQKGNRDDAIRKRVSGEDDLTSRYLGKMKNMHTELENPSDNSITTLWVGNVELDMVETDLHDLFYPYGSIRGINIVRGSSCAFIEYESREGAENAARTLYNACKIKGRSLMLSWAKPRTQAIIQPILASGESDGGAHGSGAGLEDFIMPVPPGMERAPHSAYSIKEQQSFNGSSVEDIKSSENDTEFPPNKRQMFDRPGSEQTVSFGPPPLPPGPPPKIVYPSMDPNRLGTKL